MGKQFSLIWKLLAKEKENSKEKTWKLRMEIPEFNFYLKSVISQFQRSRESQIRMREILLAPIFMIKAPNFTIKRVASPTLYTLQSSTVFLARASSSFLFQVKLSTLFLELLLAFWYTWQLLILLCLLCFFSD